MNSEIRSRDARLSFQELRRRARERFNIAKRVEAGYIRQLTQVARYTGSIIRTYAPRGVVTDFGSLREILMRYSELLRPWAKSVTAKMQAEVSNRDAKAWAELSRNMGRSLQREIATAPVGEALRQKMDEQVTLITSIPIEAAQRVHEWVMKGISEAVRPAEVADAILASTDVTVARARLIARTEVSRTSTVLTQVRAERIGSEGYIWRTALDSDVRQLHRHLEGKFVPWDKPPIAGERGERAHAGAIYNCRCWPEVVIPDEIRLIERRAA